MLVGIYKDSHNGLSAFSERYETILDFNGIDHIRLDASQPDFWERVSGLNLFIFRWRQTDDHHQLAKTIIPVIQDVMGIKCFPNLSTCWHYDDKIRQYYLLRQQDIPIVQSWIFWDKKVALKWLESASLPLVFKLKGGAGSSNVVLVKERAYGRRLVRRMFGQGIFTGHVPGMGTIKYKDFNLYRTVRRIGGDVLRSARWEDWQVWQAHKNYCLFQKYLAGNDYDTRVTVIGNRAFAFRRFTRSNDFRASGSGRIDYDVDSIDPRMVLMALQISERLGFQSMAYDFLLNEHEGPEFCEISYTYVDKAVYNCPGYWASDLSWHEGHYWPQYFQLMDVLALPDLRQPTP